jgi:hypothetical protein
MVWLLRSRVNTPEEGSLQIIIYYIYITWSSETSWSVRWHTSKGVIYYLFFQVYSRKAPIEIMHSTGSSTQYARGVSTPLREAARRISGLVTPAHSSSPCQKFAGTKSTSRSSYSFSSVGQIRGRNGKHSALSFRAFQLQQFSQLCGKSTLKQCQTRTYTKVTAGKWIFRLEDQPPTPAVLYRDAVMRSQ